MRIAIIGPMGSGKTTVFDLLTGHVEQAVAAHHPHATLGTAHVPDHRFDELAALFPEKECTPARLEFADVPPISGMRKEMEEEGGTLAFIREADALLKVIRAFDNPTIPHVAGSVDPARDLAALNSELLLADLGIVERRVKKLEESSRKPTKAQQEDREELEALKPCLDALEAGRDIRDVPLSSEQQKLLRGFRFLSEKPSVLVLNIGDDQLGQKMELDTAEETLPVAAELELELMQMDADEREQFMADYGIEQLSDERIIHKVLVAAGMITFYTLVGQEMRAWLLPQGGTTLDAAAMIHTDIARGFIRAEVVPVDDLIELKTIKDVKAHGKLRQEGREHVVNDGDVLDIRFNV